MTRIITFGAGGRAGRTISAEARHRGHDVTDVVRDPSRHPDITAVHGDVTDVGQVATPSQGHDVAVHAAADVGDSTFFAKAANALLVGLRQAGVQRLIVVGLASNLHDADGVLLRDTQGYPSEYRDFYLAHAAGTDVVREAGNDLMWTILSPAGDFDHGGTIKSTYRIAAADSAHRISYADFATAVLDEIEVARLAGTYAGLAW